MVVNFLIFCLLPPVVKKQLNLCANQVNYLTTAVWAILYHTSSPVPVFLPSHLQQKPQDKSFSLDWNSNLHCCEIYACQVNMKTQGGWNGNIQSKWSLWIKSQWIQVLEMENLSRSVLDLTISLKKFHTHHGATPFKGTSKKIPQCFPCSAKEFWSNLMFFLYSTQIY